MWTIPCEEYVAPPTWPPLRDDGRTLRAVDTIGAVEALRIRNKKQYEKCRSDSNGIGIIPRCPLKGAGFQKIGARRHMTSDRESPSIFTVSNVLTLEDCKAIITTLEVKGFYHESQLNNFGWHATTETIYRIRLSDRGMVLSPRLWWTSRLKAAFEGMPLKGFKEAHVVGVTSATVHRYEEGKMCEPHNSRELIKYHDDAYVMVHRFEPRELGKRYIGPLEIGMGYKVLLYLNGDQVDDVQVDSSGGPSKVVGGEIVLYSQHCLNGKKHITKVAPKSGMAVCIAREQGSGAIHEIGVQLVTKGVLYIMEFFVQFEGIKLPSKEKIVIHKTPRARSPKKFQELKQGKVWHKMRSQKDGDFIWSLWRKVVVVNSWRVRFIDEIDDKCLMCALDIPETIAHRFWDCKIARRAWDYAIGIINSMKAQPNQKGPWKAVHWHYCIFGKKIPTSFSKYSKVWLLLRGITLWTIWIERDNLTLNNTIWDVGKVERMIWQSLLDYARIAWRKALKDSKTEAIHGDVLAKFHTTWGGNNFLYDISNFEVMWNTEAPNVGLVNHA